MGMHLVPSSVPHTKCAKSNEIHEKVVRGEYSPAHIIPSPSKNELCVQQADLSMLTSMTP